MQQAHADRPDWRDADAYKVLLAADRSLFAWEWLRRDARYARCARDALAGANARCGLAARFGLVACEPPDRAAPEARPLWLQAAHPYVLEVGPGTSRHAADRLNLAALGGVTTMVSAGGRDHLLLSDGLRVIRLDGPQGLFRAEAVVPSFRIDGLASAERPLMTLRRLLVLCGGGGFSRALHRPEARSRRWILELRAFDALAAGADQRTIAESLLSPSAGDPRWRLREPSIRLQAQRLARAARARAGGGWRLLLA